MTRHLGRFGLVTFLLFGNWAGAQDGAEQDARLPKTPTAFDTETTGSGNQTSAGIIIPDRSPRKVTFTAVTGLRDWRNSKGKVVRARLLAFDMGETKTGQRTPTLIKGGKIRLLLKDAKRFSEIPLASLSENDQKFVRKLATGKTVGSQ